MFDTIIVSGGKISKEFALDFLKKNREKNPAIYLIAADRGLEFFMEAGLEPDLAVGDFDSLSEEGKVWLEAYGGDRAILAEETAFDVAEQTVQTVTKQRKLYLTTDIQGRNRHTEVIRLKPEKDDSDTQSALNTAIARGAKNIAILGATGSRMDHMLANMGLFILAREKQAKVTIVDAHNYMELIPSGAVLERDQQFGNYISFFPLGGTVEGLTLEGFKYALNGYNLGTIDSGLTVSNEIQKEIATVTYTKGTLLMIMSRD